ncbi:hypothetical protein CHLRE_10g464700v5 [Chlamydomonas reinhardtii]|uniref:Uncharacterized protein n=1 Tax=Chlamydomonas reinhardtii TaxID=3055 RepID=A8I1J9_CHLRE|nr:uncharacterized protein CHLRE_10g464700v5 [Chlamydomonas reinhardtii]PNW78112.1 hypothetical protein CHLRE_10g464700v5 [Chlamydomonas reinhardtii]|eukprot:XP_001698624.1 predicted protein [Chlamydomonas reinhardtii]
MEDALELADRLLLVDFSADYDPRLAQPPAAGQSRPGSRSATPPRAAVQAARDLCQRIGDAAISSKTAAAGASGPTASRPASIKLPTQLPAQQPQQQQPNGTRTPTRIGSMTARDRYGGQAATAALSPVRPASQQLTAAPTASPGFMTARGPRSSGGGGGGGGGAAQLNMRTSVDGALQLRQPSPARPVQQQQQQQLTRSQARSSSHIPYGAAAAAANMLAQAIGAAKTAGTPPRAPSGSAKPPASASGPSVPSLLLSRLSSQQPAQASTSTGGVTVIGGALGSPLSPSRSAAAQTGSPLTSRQRGSSGSITLAPHGGGALTVRSPRTPSLQGLQQAVAGVTLPAEQPPLSARQRYPAEAEAEAGGGKGGKLVLQVPQREEGAKEVGGKVQAAPAGPRGVVPSLRLGGIAR